MAYGASLLMTLGVSPRGFESRSLCVKIIVDVDYSDGNSVLMAPVGNYSPGQIREIQDVLATRKIILMPPVRETEDVWDKILRHPRPLRNDEVHR